jgi:hypothetical protein
VLGLVFKTSVRHSVSQVGSTPTSFRHSVSTAHITAGDHRLTSSTRIVCANLHREPIRIHDVETEAASLLVNRSGSPRLEIRNDGVLVEVVYSDCEMVYFAWRLTPRGSGKTGQ